MLARGYAFDNDQCHLQRFRSVMEAERESCDNSEPANHSGPSRGAGGDFQSVCSPHCYRP